MTDNNANVQHDVNTLKKYGFDKKFDGIPKLHFERDTFKPFLNALGQVSVEYATLKDCFDDIDPGANNGPIIAPTLPLGNYNGVPQIHASNAQVRQHTERERRLFNIVLASTVVGSAFYKELEEEFANQGRLACLQVSAAHFLEMDEHVLAKMEHDWTAMSVVSLKIKIDDYTLAKWLDQVLVASSEFQPEKTYPQCRLKFLTGLPPQLHAEVNAETLRPDPNYNFPPRYLAPHPRAGQIHAFAGQPDPRKLMTGFSKVWVRMLASGLIRAPSSAANIAMDDDYDDMGNVFVAEGDEDDSYDVDEYGFYVGPGRGGKGKGKGYKGKGGRGGKGKGGGRVIPFDEKTRCYQCGGLGHIYRFTRDGKTYVCPTQTQIRREILDAIIYPHLGAPGTSAAHEAAADDVDDYNGPVDEATAAVAAVNWWE